ncbi:molybdopterin-dependent oxidoreductase [Brachybacterium hainanense]|uniref:Molybdopterin-dependent oxidoreductase n=1 Tax=Brachybacterium hainanense TaxID=1541174 RepID=A0ABV6RC22_9MICO
MSTSSRTRGARLAGALTTAVAAGLGLGLAELAAALVQPRTSPVSLVGAVTIDLTPPPVKDLVIGLLGMADKPFLIGCVLAGTLAITAVIGSGLVRTARWASIWIAAVGAIAILAALLRVAVAPSSLVAGLVLAAGGIGALHLLRTLLLRAQEEQADPAAIGGASRRRLLATGAGLGALGALAPLVGRALRPAPQVAPELLAVPEPQVQAPELPEGLDVEGVSPLRTPADELYRIDTALVVPGYDPESWRLRIEGMVENPYEITLPELLAMPMVEHDATMLCVSNPVGGDLIGSIRFQGVRVRDLLARAVPLRGADQVLSTSVDGFTAGTPLEALTDDREALIAVAINGEPLSPEHGAPARLFTPGLYGYVGATKWLTTLSVGTYAEQVAYWTSRGWSAKGPVKTSARIDTPRGDGRVEPGADGRVAVAGVAWAVHRGVGAVQLQVDDGEWIDAELSEDVGADYWRQWVVRLELAPGEHLLTVRAADASGELQSAEVAPPAPNGSQGYHRISVDVRG